MRQFFSNLNPSHSLDDIPTIALWCICQPRPVFLLLPTTLFSPDGSLDTPIYRSHNAQQWRAFRDIGMEIRRLYSQPPKLYLATIFAEDGATSKSFPPSNIAKSATAVVFSKSMTLRYSFEISRIICNFTENYISMPHNHIEYLGIPISGTFQNFYQKLRRIGFEINPISSQRPLGNCVFDGVFYNNECIA